jgi:hypothetical protein
MMYARYFENLTGWEWFGLYLLTGFVVFGLMRLIVSYLDRHEPGQSEFRSSLSSILNSSKSKRELLVEKALEIVAIPIMLLIWPIGFVWGLHMRIETTNRKPKPEDAFKCKRAHLVSHMTTPDAEKLGLIVDPLNRAPELPFGHLNAGWLAFLQKAKPGDALWYFEIPSKEMTKAEKKAEAKTKAKDQEPKSIRYRGFAWIQQSTTQTEFIFESD